MPLSQAERLAIFNVLPTLKKGESITPINGVFAGEKSLQGHIEIELLDGTKITTSNAQGCYNRDEHLTSVLLHTPHEKEGISHILMSGVKIYADCIKSITCLEEYQMPSLEGISIRQKSH